MGKIRNRFWAASLAAVLFLSAIAACYAEPAPAGDTEEVVTSQVEFDSSAYLVPIQRDQSEINGEMVITEIYEVPASFDPTALTKPNFVQGNYLYAQNSIVKTPFIETREKEVEMEFESPVDSANLGDHLSELPVNMAYDVDGWTGTLYLNPQTVSIKATGHSTKSKINTQTNTYNLEMNDPTQVPQSYNGMSLTDLKWTPSGFIDGSSIPSGYTATATYSSKTKYTVANGWSMSATYTGTAHHEDTNNIRYTVTYQGQKIPEGHYVMNGQLVPDGYTLDENGNMVKVKEEKPISAVLGGIGASVLVCALIAGLAIFILWALKKGLLYSHKIVIQAQDDASGEYSVIQKVRVSAKAPGFTLDTLKAPSSRHFLCEMSGQMANKLKGKIINVTADGTVVTKHRIEPLNETEKYVFPIDLEVVEAGPIDTFSL